MTITDYKLIQANGNMELAAEVGRFMKLGEGWAPEGSPFIVGTKQVTDAGPTCDVHLLGPIIRIYAQAIVKREPESESLRVLLEWHREALEAITAWQQGQVDAESALGHIAGVMGAKP